MPLFMAWRIVFEFVRLVPRLMIETFKPVLPSFLRGTGLEVTESDWSAELSEAAPASFLNITLPSSPEVAILVEVPRNSLRVHFILLSLLFESVNRVSENHKTMIQPQGHSDATC